MHKVWQRARIIGEWILDRTVLPIIILLFPNGFGEPKDGEPDGKE